MVKEVNNSEKIKEFIINQTPNLDKDKDIYYVIELIRRGKDNPDLSAANVHFKNYYINKIEDVDKFMPEIIGICNLLNIRAYFAVNRKSYQQVMWDTIAEMSRRSAAHDYKKPYSIWESCSGKYFQDSNKLWVLDIDKEDADEYNATIEQLASLYKSLIEGRCQPKRDIIATIPTMTGLHIISKPFDVCEFNNALVELGLKPHNDQTHQIIKKNHLTLLYYKKEYKD